MPATFDNTNILLSKLPKDKVYILDRLKPDLKIYPALYQNFENDICDALEQGLEFGEIKLQLGDLLELVDKK